MKISFRAPGLAADQLRAMAATVRAAFRDVSHRIACIVVAVSAEAEKRHAARNCVIEVHMPDGHVEYVEERQRRQGAALRRAVHRAWKAAARWLMRQLPRPQEIHLPRRELQPIPVRATDTRRDQR